VIRVGWLPSQARPSQQRRRTMPYKRVMRRPRRTVASPPSAVNDGDMIFDQPPAELPVATLMPKSRRTQLAADLRAWLGARWSWFKPRTVPMIVAFLGLLAVVGSANYLRNYGRETPERLPAAAPTVGKLVIEQGPPGVDIVVDGKKLGVLPILDVPPSHCGVVITPAK
jgi:hypothetical protein